RRGAVERGEEMEEGTLAGAALADDGDHLAGGDGEVEVAKENDLAGGAGVRAGRSRIRRDCRIDFGQADCAQQCECIGYGERIDPLNGEITHSVVPRRGGLW